MSTTTDRPRRRRLLVGLGLVTSAGLVTAALIATGLSTSPAPGGGEILPPIPYVDGAGAQRITESAGAGAGSVAVGTTAYEPDADSLFVSPGGRNDAPGTRDAPLRTIKAAIDRADAGATIVLRAGEYHESFTIPEGKPLTIQSFPLEEVWLDGSRPTEGWSADGAHWSAPWDVVLDSSPTYTRGAPDNIEEHYRFVPATHPWAAHPDQVWWEDRALTQVGGLDELTRDAFFHDEDAGLLYLGADPAGSEIRASSLQRAISIRAEDTVIRGIGIRRFAPSVPDFGAVTIERPRALLENVVISESATTGLFVTAADATLRQMSIRGNGMIGIAGNRADGLVVHALDVSGNNTERFNRAPVAGGLKLTRSRTVVVSDSRFSDNAGTGLWFDQSSRDIAVTGSRLSGNSGHGVFVELSARAVIAGNYIAENDRLGMKINNTSSVEIRNNVVLSTTSGISVLQDERAKSDPDVPGHDERYMDDPEMTWLVTDTRIVDNTLVGSGHEALVWIEDYSRARGAEELRTVMEGNVFARAAGAAPSIVAWPMTPEDVTRFDSLDELTRTAGQEFSGREFRGTEAVDRNSGGVSEPPPPLPWVAIAFGGFPHVLSALDQAANPS